MPPLSSKAKKQFLELGFHQHYYYGRFCIHPECWTTSIFGLKPIKHLAEGIMITATLGFWSRQLSHPHACVDRLGEGVSGRLLTFNDICISPRVPNWIAPRLRCYLCALNTFNDLVRVIIYRRREVRPCSGPESSITTTTTKRIDFPEGEGH